MLRFEAEYRAGGGSSSKIVMLMRQEGDDAVERGVRDVWKQWRRVSWDERFAAGWT